MKIETALVIAVVVLKMQLQPLRLLLRVAAKKPDLPPDNPSRPLINAPSFAEVWPTGAYFSIPVFALVWFLMVERKSPGLSVFWAVVFLAAVAITHKMIKEFFRGGAVMIKLREGWRDFCRGLASGARQMIAIAIATAAAGIIVGAVTLTGMQQFVAELIETLSGGNLIVILLLAAAFSGFGKLRPLQTYCSEFAMAISARIDGARHSPAICALPCQTTSDAKIARRGHSAKATRIPKPAKTQMAIIGGVSVIWKPFAPNLTPRKPQLPPTARFICALMRYKPECGLCPRRGRSRAVPVRWQRGGLIISFLLAVIGAAYFALSALNTIIENETALVIAVVVLAAAAYLLLLRVAAKKPDLPR